MSNVMYVCMYVCVLCYILAFNDLKLCIGDGGDDDDDDDNDDDGRISFIVA